MSLNATATINIGYRSTVTIAELFNLPVPKIDDTYAMLNAKEVREWCVYNTLELSLDVIENLGKKYRYLVRGLQDYSNFQAGLRAINELVIISTAMQSHATSYIYSESNICVKGKGRKDQLRKATKKYRFIFC